MSLESKSAGRKVIDCCGGSRRLIFGSPAAEALLAVSLLAGVVVWATPAQGEVIRGSQALRQHQPAGVVLNPTLPSPHDFPMQLVIDDGSAELDFGVVGDQSIPFLWFNRFNVASAFSLEQVWVLFPDDDELVGAKVELAIYQDEDGDPRNGAQLYRTALVRALVADGKTFSVYDLDPVVRIDHQEVYLGVVSRYAEAAVGPTFPAALDIEGAPGSAWVALWKGPPPIPPVLPGADETFPIDDIIAGSWLIRGFGSPPGPTIEVPTLERLELTLLACWLSLAGVMFLRDRLKVRRG